MATVPAYQRVAKLASRSRALSLPKWVRRLFNSQRLASTSPSEVTDGHVQVRGCGVNNLRLITIQVRNADALCPLEFQHQTVDAYSAIEQQLRIDPPWYPLRIWNWIPQIHAVASDRLDRYMVFNAGRFAAYRKWYADEQTLETCVATATGIGHGRSDLVIHVLASSRPGRPIENERQVQSYRYSSRFGPMPPCFARAMLVPDGDDALPDMLVAGTASVRGEESVYSGDVTAQTKETIRNLASVVQAGLNRAGRNRKAPACGDPSSWLSRFDGMRIYYVNPKHVPDILDVLSPHIGHLREDDIELVRADICRRELLVEIEGTVRFDPDSRCDRAS